jgi:Zyg-11 family protein
LYLILEALATHRYNRTLQISGTAALFYAIRSTIMDAVVKRRVVEVMLNALENFNDEAVIVRNASLSFCQLNIPNDVAFCYTQMVSLLVNVLNSHAGGESSNYLYDVCINWKV